MSPHRRRLELHDITERMNLLIYCKCYFWTSPNDLHDAEDQRQAGGHERQDHAGDDAVDGLDQDLVDGN